MKTKLPPLLLAGAVLLGSVSATFAHCDSLDGPVIIEARTAIADGDVTPVLKWVRADDEAAIRAAFAQTLEVRQLSPAAAELADRSFFETLVRIHRAGEGESFTGLKPAGTTDAVIVAADQAIENGSFDAQLTELTTKLDRLLRARFDDLQRRREHRDHHVPAGREYVEAYVGFIHLYERLAQIADTPADAPAHAHAH